MMTGQGRRLGPPRPERQPVPAGPHLWAHVYETAVLVTLGTVLAAWLLPASVPPWELSGILAAVTAVAWAVTLHSTASAGLAAWLLACGLALAAWLGYARVTGAWTRDAIMWLVLAFAVLPPFGPPLIAACRLKGKFSAEAEEKARQALELKRWKTVFESLGVRGVEITQIFRHPNGIQVHGQLGQATDEHGIVTFDQLKEYGPQIVTHFRKAASAASFTQPDPDNAAAFILHLRTRKGRRQTEYLPDDGKRTSVNKPLHLGNHDDGSPFRLLLREIAVMIVGVIGSGKSNLLNLFIGRLAWCEDVLICVIDLKGMGGRMSRPWLMPWIENPWDPAKTEAENKREGRIRRPVIEWVATTRAEAKLMLEALIAAGDARGEEGAGGEKLTARRDKPGIALIMDETVVATGHGRKDDGISSRDLAVLLSRLVETYRSEAFTPVIAAVRGDVETMGMSAIKAQTLVRIGLRVSQSMDADSVFPDDHAAAKILAKITDDGAGLARVKGRMSSITHFFRITPKIAYYIAKRTGPLRPAPDPVLEAGLNQVLDDEGRGAYEARWDRMAGKLETWKRTAAEWKADPDIGIRGGPDREPAARKSAVAVADREPGAVSDEEYVDSVLRETIASVLDPEPDGKAKNAARRRMRELLRQAGPDGLRVGTLEKMLADEARAAGNPEMRVHRNTLHEWLRADEELGRVRNERPALHKPKSPYARWVWIRQADDGDFLARDDPDDHEEDLP